MGFKNLNLLNILLLAKQCWRILCNPDEMWVKVIKGIYFSRCSIMEARKGAKASWAWASILEGRDFFKENMRCQVMNGEEVEFWKDKWIDGVCLKEFIRNEQKESQKVAEFIDDEGRWRLELVKERLGEGVIREIEAVPICKDGGKDRIVWPSPRDGRYSVKAGYQVIKEKIKEKVVEKATSSHKIDNRAWKEIWKLDVPTKVKNIIWRACGNYVATNYNLWKRKVKQSPLCLICMKEEETVEHIMLQCEWVKSIWFGIDIEYKVDKQ